MKHGNCPVCGYAEMPYPPKPYKICPCCGTEFGVDDSYSSHDELRKAWIHSVMPWFSDIRRPPKGWSPALQLIKAGHGADLYEVTAEKTEDTWDSATLGMPLAEVLLTAIRLGIPALNSESKV